ncbi:hypothetical protein F0562_005106 [Nyssa sinensis]|uniref:CCHC-type domain-containing protein n=1 Tax=Nyssa sinensis TaxID=561372 RepID=A0A5J5ALL5_9ASTE|nr:hypothetical protein F0562_005106 [Nyssa sinensis]
MEMSHLASKLRAHKLDLSEDLLVHLVLISLPTQFSQFKVSYNCQKETWSLNELISHCVQEEERLKQEKIESAHLAGTSKDKGNKRKKDKEAAEVPYQKKQHKEKNVDGCFFCGAAGHKNKQCTNYHAWRAKKGTLLNLVCSEVNLTLVPKHTWWLDSGATTHISVSMQGCLSYRKPNDGERYIFVGDGKKVEVEAIGIFRSIFETGNARFFEDVEFDGGDKDRDFIFEEEYVDIPTVVIDVDQASIPDIVQEADPNQNNIQEPLIPKEQTLPPSEPTPLRRSTKERKSAVPNDYIVFLQEHEFDIDPLPDSCELSGHLFNYPINSEIVGALDTMSQVFEGYERQYCEISANLSKKCTSASLLDGEQKKQKVSEIKAGLDEAESLIRKMDLEARSLQPNVKAVLLAKLREYKSDLNNLKSQVKRISSTNLNQAARDELLESGMADALTVSADQRGRLLMSTERVDKSSDRIRESRRTMLETEELGVSILQDLHQQRQSLLHANNTLHGVDDNISKSKKILTAMSRRMSRNKWIIGSVIAVLVIAIILILYFKLSK